MKLFRLINLHSTELDEWADYIVLGTFLKKDYCIECRIPLPLYSQINTEPLQIEWQVVSDKIGDFSWAKGTSQFIVLDNVKDYLLEKNFELNFGEVEILPHRKKRKIPPYPYTGPHLNWLIVRESIELDIEKSGLEIKKNCKKCGYTKYKTKDEHLFISKKNWSGEKIFHIKQFWINDATYITQDALDLILSQNFSNFWYKEVGEIEE